MWRLVERARAFGACGAAFRRHGVKASRLQKGAKVSTAPVSRDVTDFHVTNMQGPSHRRPQPQRRLRHVRIRDHLRRSRFRKWARGLARGCETAERGGQLQRALGPGPDTPHLSTITAPPSHAERNAWPPAGSAAVSRNARRRSLHVLLDGETPSDSRFLGARRHFGEERIVAWSCMQTRTQSNPYIEALSMRSCPAHVVTAAWLGLGPVRPGAGKIEAQARVLKPLRPAINHHHHHRRTQCCALSSLVVIFERSSSPSAPSLPARPFPLTSPRHTAPAAAAPRKAQPSPGFSSAAVNALNARNGPVFPNPNSYSDIDVHTLFPASIPSDAFAALTSAARPARLTRFCERGTKQNPLAILISPTTTTLPPPARSLPPSHTAGSLNGRRHNRHDFASTRSRRFPSPRGPGTLTRTRLHSLRFHLVPTGWLRCGRLRRRRQL